MRAVVVAIVIACGAAAQTDYGYLRDLTWVTKDGASIHALWSFRGGEGSHEASMRAESPSGRRYRFSHALDTRSGTVRVRLTQEETGWWVELVTDLGVQRPDLNALMQAFDPANLPPGHQVTMTLTSSSGEALPATRVAYASGEEYRSLAGKFTLKDAPADLAADLEFFESAFTAENEYGFEFRPLVVASRVALGGHAPAAAVKVQASNPRKP